MGELIVFLDKLNKQEAQLPRTEIVRVVCHLQIHGDRDISLRIDTVT